MDRRARQVLRLPPIVPMNVVDLLLVAIVVAGAWGGWQRGFAIGAAELLTLAASVAAALATYGLVARWFGADGFGVWTMPLAFVGVLVVARIALGIVARRLLTALPERAHRHRANRALGLLPGAARGLVHVAVIAALLMALPLDERLGEEVRASALAEQLSRPAQWIESRLTPIFDPAAKATLGRLTVRPGSQETVQLPFRVARPHPRPDLEARMLDLVNAERAEAGLRALLADPPLADVARRHSADMFARGYFSHVTPEGRDPFDRMRAANVRYLVAGENLALARSLQLAHDGLMHSPGHRANILRPAFGRVGIGVLDGGMHGIMVTQDFRN
jgi:uncharacterized protein YkwD